MLRFCPTIRGFRTREHKRGVEFGSFVSVISKCAVRRTVHSHSRRSVAKPVARYLLVIVDRITKLVRFLPVRTVKEWDVARACTAHWAYAYGIPHSVVTNSEPQFDSRCTLDLYRALGVKGVFETTHHPQTNGQTNALTGKFLSALRRFTSDDPRDLDLYCDAVTYAYNTQKTIQALAMLH